MFLRQCFQIEVAKAVQYHWTFLTGTIRLNRRLPATIKDANVAPGTTNFMRQGYHLFAAQKGSNSRRPVRLLFTSIYANSSEGVPQIDESLQQQHGRSPRSRYATSVLEYMYHEKIIKGVEKDGLRHSLTHAAKCKCAIQIKHRKESD